MLVDDTPSSYFILLIANIVIINLSIVMAVIYLRSGGVSAITTPLPFSLSPALSPPPPPLLSLFPFLFPFSLFCCLLHLVMIRKAFSALLQHYTS